MLDFGFVRFVRESRQSAANGTGSPPWLERNRGQAARALKRDADDLQLGDGHVLDPALGVRSDEGRWLPRRKSQSWIIEVSIVGSLQLGGFKVVLGEFMTSRRSRPTLPYHMGTIYGIARPLFKIARCVARDRTYSDTPYTPFRSLTRKRSPAWTPTSARVLPSITSLPGPAPSSWRACRSATSSRSKSQSVP
jgi:hypothetical protein